jgi:hypothetical protein
MARPDEPPPRWGVAADALVVLMRRGADKAVVGQSPTVVGPTEPTAARDRSWWRPKDGTLIRGQRRWRGDASLVFRSQASLALLTCL